MLVRMVAIWLLVLNTLVLWYGCVMASEIHDGAADGQVKPTERSGRRIASGIVVSPGGLVSLGPDDTLRWEFDRVEWKLPPDDLLDRFIVLWQKRPKDIIAFAEKWGPLRIDSHGAQNRALSGSEPISAWRFLSRRAYSVLRLARDLESGKPGEEDDWALLSTGRKVGSPVPINPPNELFRALGNHLRWEFDDRAGRGGFRTANEYGRAIIAGEVSNWLEMFTVYLRLEWEPRWQIEMQFRGRFLAAVALQMALAVANAESLFTCNGCGRPYIRKKQRKPNAGQANFCSDCTGRRKPQREAEKRYRESRREARKLAGAGVPVAEIARKLDRSPAVIRGWLKRG
jgi:transposase-like protein